MGRPAAILALATVALVAVASPLAVAALPSASAGPSREAAASPPLVVEPLRPGQRWRGRLPGVGDSARFGITLAAPQHLSLHLAQPKGADAELRIASGGKEVLRQRAFEPGGTLVIELWLEGGDHVLTLEATRSADRRYRLLLLPLDPFVVPADSEPNGGPTLARTIPPSLRWEGGPAGAEPDVDGYWLPPLATPGEVRIHVSGEQPLMRLFADPERTQRIELVRAGDMLIASQVPTGRPLFLEVEAEGAYGIELEAPGWTPADEPLAPPVELELTFDVPAGFSCGLDGATVPGRLTVVDAGAVPLELDLHVASSDPAWQLALQRGSVALGSGESVDVPVSLGIEPTGCARANVALSLAAVAADGGVLSTTLLLAADDLAPGEAFEAGPERLVDTAPSCRAPLDVTDRQGCSA
jgi:hypothetical protein